MNRTLAFDIGEKRTGAAISDGLGITAQPVGVRERTGYKSELRWVRELMDEYEIERIIIGHPVNMDGSSGKMAQMCEKIAEKLKKDLTGIEIALWDERLTTAGAERTLIMANVSRKKRKKVVDQLAAQLILSSWLDANPGQLHRGEK